MIGSKTSLQLPTRSPVLFLFSQDKHPLLMNDEVTARFPVTYIELVMRLLYQKEIKTGCPEYLDICSRGSGKGTFPPPNSPVLDLVSLVYRYVNVQYWCVHIALTDQPQKILRTNHGQNCHSQG